MKRIKLPKAVRYSFISLLFLFIIVISIIDRLEVTNRWLKTNAPIKSEILIIERWIPPVYFYDIVREIKENSYKKIIITGLKTTNSVNLYRNGQLVIKNLKKNTNKTNNKIKIVLQGSWAKQAYSICRIRLSDSTLWDNEVKKTQKLTFNLSISDQDSLMLAFTNDAVEDRFDRNLKIKHVLVNGEKINLYADKNYVTQGKSNNPTNHFNNMKDIAAYTLISNNIPKEKIISLEAKKGGLSKTYNSATTATEWMIKNNYNTANIISLSYHSTRTFYSFKKANPEFIFGIKPLKASSSKSRTIKELVGNFLIRISPKFILDLPKEKE